MKAPNPYAWDYSSAIAVEVEMSPQKSRNQLLKNFKKKMGTYFKIRFVVTSDNHAEQIQEMLGEDWIMRDPERLRVQVVKFEDLNKLEPGKDEEAEGSQQRQGKQPLGRAEEMVLTLVVTGGYTSREEIREEVQRGGTRGRRKVGLQIPQDSDKEGSSEEGRDRLRADGAVDEAIPPG